MTKKTLGLVVLSVVLAGVTVFYLGWRAGAASTEKKLGEARVAVSQTAQKADTPEETLERFLDAINRKAYLEALDWHTQEARSLFGLDPSYIIEKADYISNNGNIAGFTVDRMQASGGKTKASVTVRYRDGSTRRFDFDLVDLDGWKITGLWRF